MTIPWNSLKSFCTKRTVSSIIDHISFLSFSPIFLPPREFSNHFALQFMFTSSHILFSLASIIQCFNFTPVSQFLSRSICLLTFILLLLVPPQLSLFGCFATLLHTYSSHPCHSHCPLYKNLGHTHKLTHSFEPGQNLLPE